MRLYQCFEITDKDSPHGDGPLLARDLRTEQPCVLYHSRPTSFHVFSRQVEMQQICAPLHLELFTDGGSFWLAAPNEASAWLALPQLQQEGAFAEHVLAQPTNCPQCGNPAASAGSLCVDCLLRNVASEKEDTHKEEPRSHAKWWAIAALGAAAVLILIAVLAIVLPVSAPTVQFYADRTTITQGQPVTLYWKTTNANEVILDPGLGSRSTSGSLQIYPTVDVTYAMHASGGGKTLTEHVVITVLHPPVTHKAHAGNHPDAYEPRKMIQAPKVTFSAGPPIVDLCEQVSLHWNVTGDYRGIIIQPGSLTPLSSGSVKVLPMRTTDFEIQVNWDGGEPMRATRTVAVIRSTRPGPPRCGEMVWTGIVPNDGLITINCTNGRAVSEPVALNPIGSCISAIGATVSSPDFSTAIVQQPPASNSTQFIVSTSKRGITTLHLQWSLNSR